MAQMGRPGLSPDEKLVVWEQWKKGESFSDIGRIVNKHAGSIFGVLKIHGGIAPATKKRSLKSLQLWEREEISRGLSAGLSLRAISRNLNRAPSTISREVRSNGGEDRYRAVNADDNAWSRASRPKQCALSARPKLCRLVERKLAIEWSPEQIAGWLKKTYPSAPDMNLSHETIYKSLFIQSRGALKKELTKHLRSGRLMRHSHKHTRKGIDRGIIDAISIHQRPPEVEDRAIPGHWEGDLISGSNNTHIATLVERQSRYTILAKTNGKDTKNVVDAIIKQVKALPSELKESLTWDRGMELADHKRFTVDTDMAVYFCDPASPWQRGTNENTNRLLRQYLPKKTDLSVHSQNDLNKIARRLNQRPRKTLDFDTPADILNRSVALTT